MVTIESGCHESRAGCTGEYRMRVSHHPTTKEMPMREAVIVASSRTGLAKSFRGSFNLTRPDDIAAHCVKDVLRKVPQLDPAEIEDVVMGTGFPEGPQGFNTGRNVALMAGLPVAVPGGT